MSSIYTKTSLAHVLSSTYNSGFLFVIHFDLTDWIDTLYSDYQTANEISRTAPDMYLKCHWASVDGQEIGPVGFKMKGNFSVLFNAAQLKTKFPFKIAFDEYMVADKYLPHFFVFAPQPNILPLCQT